MKKTLKCFALAIVCLLMLSGGASAGNIFISNFDDPAISGYWKVYETFDGWDLLSGQGIEVQTNTAIPDADAHSGNQYIELDSDPYNHVGYANSTDDNVPTNSAMGRELTLTAGTYNLSFWYQPRANTTTGSCGITYGLWAGSSFDSVFGTISKDADDQPDWVLVSTSFNISTDGVYKLAFAATGASDKRGGFIDDVKLDAVPIPGAIWLLGSGLLGLVGIRRRKS